jgi:ABC-2 type transport system ATP-binding protein
LNNIVEFCEVRKNYKDVTALAGLTFFVPDQGCLGLLGPNGAGKTTAIKCLLKLTRIDSGVIHNRALQIGYMPQTPAVFGWMSAEEFLRFVGSTTGVPSKQLNSRIHLWLKKMDLSKSRRRRVSGFSGGMKQRLALAAALLSEPDLVVLDEPVSALDPIGRHEVLGLINEIKKERCILMSTHILNDAERVCDNVVIMREGQAILQDSMDRLTKEIAQELEIEFRHDDESILPVVKAIGKQPWVRQVQTNGFIVHIYTDGEDRMIDLLALLGSFKEVHIERIQQGKASLEDIFLQAVKMK